MPIGISGLWLNGLRGSTGRKRYFPISTILMRSSVVSWAGFSRITRQYGSRMESRIGHERERIGSPTRPADEEDRNAFGSFNPVVRTGRLVEPLTRRFAYWATFFSRGTNGMFIHWWHIFFWERFCVDIKIQWGSSINWHFGPLVQAWSFDILPWSAAINQTLTSKYRWL